MTTVVVGASVGVTALMSLLFHGRLAGDMLATGFICAIIVDVMVRRVTRHYRRRLAEAHALLEDRVRERTAELNDANRGLRDAASMQDSLRAELHVRDRMATAGMVAAGVSHEIRSPLSVIAMATDEVIETLGASPEHAEACAMLDDVRDAAERITVILRDLTSLARPGDEPLAPVELGPVIDSALRLASYKLGPNVTLAREIGGAPAVIGNSSRLVQVVLNLVVNAARATRDGERNMIAIAVRSDGAGDRDSVVLAISDTGTGMSAETQARLFEPFFTTGADRGGTGLGLAICRSIVESMGGSIGITSELGRGTTVSVTLRRAASSYLTASRSTLRMSGGEASSSSALPMSAAAMRP